jgi:hypothetical protein
MDEIKTYNEEMLKISDIADMRRPTHQQSSAKKR